MSKLSLAVEKAAPAPRPTVETAIARLAQADRALAEAIEVADAVGLVQSAKMLDSWASAVHAGKDHERQAAVFVLRAIRNAGERIAAAQARGDVATQARHPGSVVDGDTASPATLAEIGVTRDESSDWKRLAEQYPTDDELRAAAESMERPSLAGALRLAPMMSSETDEWYTPHHVVDAAVAALGAIDLDPCSNPGEPNVPARTRFTAEDDGLAQGWRGRVYMNPPYSRADDFCRKLADEVRFGNVEAAIALVPSRTDTAWFRSLSGADVLCFVSGRLKFLQPTGEPANSAPFPSMAVYFGPSPERFAAAFGPLGVLYVRLEGKAA